MMHACCHEIYSTSSVIKVTFIFKLRVIHQSDQNELLCYFCYIPCKLHEFITKIIFIFAIELSYHVHKHNLNQIES